jgi:hypothetical protein
VSVTVGEEEGARKGASLKCLVWCVGSLLVKRILAPTCCIVTPPGSEIHSASILQLDTCHSSWENQVDKQIPPTPITFKAVQND